jgi:hypothetical protein
MNTLIVDMAMMFYFLFIVAAFFGSFFYASYMISKTGLFLLHSIIAVVISVALGLFALIGWFVFTWGFNEFLFFGGLSFGAGLIVVGVVVLFTLLCVKRKQFLSIYHDETKEHI